MGAVCTENLIPFDCVTESPNVNGDDRAALLLPDPVRLAVQVEEPTRGRERGAPTSADRGTAEDSWSCPPQERRSLVLSPAVSMVELRRETELKKISGFLTGRTFLRNHAPDIAAMD